ncbi:PilZ domain-containing protein [Erythrobacter alti]|uniref:PilZ domain-containing protein n=1 Tax=Erythrobacter alti TaxID=1896145 RepID=UPI0030F3C3A0
MGNLLPRGDYVRAKAPVKRDKRELRAAPRFTLLIRAAKLVTDAGEFLCVIRDASELGLSARIFHPLPRGNTMVVELQNGDRLDAELVWQKDDRAGFRFLQPVNVKTIIECPSSFSKRPVRINVSAPARIESTFRSEKAQIHDISQQGAKLACDGVFAIDEKVKLRAAGMRDTQAKVRWRQDGFYGLVFEETFQFGELARIARNLQRPD